MSTVEKSISRLIKGSVAVGELWEELNKSGEGMLIDELRKYGLNSDGNELALTYQLLRFSLRESGNRRWNRELDEISTSTEPGTSGTEMDVSKRRPSLERSAKNRAAKGISTLNPAKGKGFNNMSTSKSTRLNLRKSEKEIGVGRISEPTSIKEIHHHDGWRSFKSSGSISRTEDASLPRITDTPAAANANSTKPLTNKDKGSRVISNNTRRHLGSEENIYLACIADRRIIFIRKLRS